MFSVAVFCLIGPVVAWGAVSPSQVLVLYNGDWREDAPLTEPGQDSLEIAEHYVRMHSDPDSGEKPYLLGLKCRHGLPVVDQVRHLNERHLPEESSDNSAGVEPIKRRWLAGADESDGTLRDRRLMEFTLPGGPEGWKIATLRFEIQPDSGSTIRVIDQGEAVVAGAVAGRRGKDWTLRLDGKQLAAGALTARASCEAVDGKRHDWQERYVDADDVRFSLAGRDGVRDDRNYLEDVEQPLKAFLEDPANARPDGTLLKDHILYIVVCYGLPRTAISTWGIACGITDYLPNHGAIIDFGQRLQLLYYNEARVMGVEPKPHRFTGKGPFTDFLLRAPQAWPLYGPGNNPFAHPLAYEKKYAPFNETPVYIEFTPANRRKFADRHLYFVMRIDAADPLQARGLIDRAVYASRFGGVGMGQVAGGDYPQSKERVGNLRGSKTGQWLWEKGVRHLNASRNRLELFHLPAGEGFFNAEPVYLPGGVGATVISHNGWGKGEMVRDLARGVTATVGAARVYNGAPHIHSHSWWDDEIFYPALFKGVPLGEALLINQVHLGWITTFVGDPLYCPPSVPRRDEAGPSFDPVRDVQVRTVKGKSREVWLTVDLGGTPERPQAAQLRAVDAAGREVVCPTFEARPYVKLGAPKEVCDTRWRVEVMDPFGRRYSSDVPVDCSDGGQKTGTAD
jgi:hypothetical protein